MAPRDKVFEDYFRDRYAFLVDSEEDSVLLNVLRGVGSIESSSDIITVLKRYDGVAEGAVPNYWSKRLSGLNVFLENQGQSTISPLGSVGTGIMHSFFARNPSANRELFRKFTDSELYAKDQVNFYERFFAGDGETITGFEGIVFL